MFKQQTFKLRLRNLRQAYNVTLDSLCQICISDEGDYISQSTLSLWENCKRTPTVDNLQLIADIFAVNLDWLTAGVMKFILKAFYISWNRFHHFQSILMVLKLQYH